MAVARNMKIEEAFKIYVDRLRDGQECRIEESFDPAFLNVDEKELRFTGKVKVSGEAYLTKDSLILHFDTIEAAAEMPCLICNEWTDVKVLLEGVTHVESLADIKGAIFDYSGVLREEIILEIPNFLECNEGACPRRKDIEKFIKKPENADQKDTYHPFADL